VADHEPREMPQDDAVGVDDALRRPGGAAGIDDGRIVLGVGVGGFEGSGVGRQRRAERHLVGPRLGADRDHRLQVLAVGPDRPKGVDVGLVDDDGGGAGVSQPIAECLGPEQRREWDRNCPEFPYRDVSDRRLGLLWRVHPDPVARPDTVGGEQVRQSVGPVPKVGEGDRLLGPVGPFAEDGDAVVVGCPPVTDVRRDVERLRDLPLEVVA